MSIKLMVSVWEAKGLTPTEKLVALCLADFANQDEKCWPSQSLISERCGIKRETVNRTISSLAKKGIVEIQSRSNANGRQSNIYKMAVSRYVTNDHRHVTQPSTPCDPGSQTPVTQDHTEPPLEPSKEDIPPIVPPEGEKPKRKTRIPDDFNWDDKRRGVAIKHDVVDPEREFQVFINHHAGKGTVMLDWDRAWVTWCMKSKQFSGNAQASPGRQPEKRSALMQTLYETMK